MRCACPSSPSTWSNWRRSSRCMPRAFVGTDVWCMSAKTDIAVLEEQVRKSVQLLAKLDRFYRTFIETDLPRWGRTQAAAIVLADVFGRFYTCGETLFLRVSP